MHDKGKGERKGKRERKRSGSLEEEEWGREGEEKEREGREGRRYCS